jgi:hypothetical protein
MNHSPGSSLAWRLLQDGVPPTLLIDLLDPEGLAAALAAELLPADVAAAPAPRLTADLPLVRTA